MAACHVLFVRVFSLHKNLRSVHLTLYTANDNDLQGSAVADKSALNDASRRTCCKQIRWTFLVINFRPKSPICSYRTCI